MKGDVRNIISLHEDAHNIPGMLGSLAITKVYWKNCPTAMKGQFQGKEKCAAIGQESVVDDIL
jgi:hypothetical protein